MGSLAVVCIEEMKKKPKWNVFGKMGIDFSLHVSMWLLYHIKNFYNIGMQ